MVAWGHAVIELTQGKYALVAESALPLLAPHRWLATKCGRIFYAATTVRRKKLYMHRLLVGLDFGDPLKTDHENGCGLDNRPSNLRIVDDTGNANNQHGKHPNRLGEIPTSRFPGVSWHKRTRTWRADIGVGGKQINLGHFTAENDAASAYARAKVVRDSGGTRAEIKAAAKGGAFV